MKVFITCVLVSLLTCVSFDSNKIKVLIVDGVNNQTGKEPQSLPKPLLSRQVDSQWIFALLPQEMLQKRSGTPGALIFLITRSS